MTKQKALLIIKPDGVKRGLSGTILKRFEQVGLTIVGLTFKQVNTETVVKHYPETDTWFEKVGKRTLTNCAAKNIDVTKVFKTDNAIEIGKTVKKWLISYFQESPVLIVAIEGYEVIEIIRKLSGNTIPLLASPGTIRGDFSHDCIDLANEQLRPLRNIIHASDTIEDGEKEIALWFTQEELFSYKRTDETIMFP